MADQIKKYHSVTFTSKAQKQDLLAGLGKLCTQWWAHIVCNVYAKRLSYVQNHMHVNQPKHL